LAGGGHKFFWGRFPGFVPVFLPLLENRSLYMIKELVIENHRPEWVILLGHGYGETGP